MCKILNIDIIAGNIHQLRKMHNMTVIDLARKLNVSMETVRGWERAKTIPTLLNVLKLCNLFDVKVDILIGNLAFEVR